MIDIKDKIRDTVSVFYRNPFKVFCINSCDGETIIKPVGYFVSLGITTAPRVLEEIKGILEDSGFTAFLCEISSKRRGNQFINTITNTENPGQYIIDELESNMLGEIEARERFKELKEDLSIEKDLADIKSLVIKISELEELISKLDKIGGWNLHRIKETASGFSLFHTQVNYRVIGDLEYRVGIYVSEGSN